MLQKTRFQMMAVGAVAIVAALFWFSLLQNPSSQETALRTDRVTIETQAGKEHEFSVEVAKTPAEQAIGLMFRQNMPEDHGMIFLLGRPARATSFWMKNTLIPLDMLFIGDDGTIRHIHENAVPQSLASVPSEGPVVAVIEINGGLARKLGIAAGDKVVYPYFK